MNSCVGRRLTDRRCCCWTSRQCKSVWTWSWDRPSSCATTSSGSSWHFISSLLRSWRGTRCGMWLHPVLCVNPFKINGLFFFFFRGVGFPPNTGPHLESFLFHNLRGHDRRSNISWSLGRGKDSWESRRPKGRNLWLFDGTNKCKDT